jgi:Leucine Rich repeat
LAPILHSLVFPNLKYLGLRNSEFSDEIALEVVKSPIIQFITVLDLSMGTLSDAGAEALLDIPDANQLKILNVSENFLSDEMIIRLSQLGCHVLANNQKDEYEYDEEEYDEIEFIPRYCSVAE